MLKVAILDDYQNVAQQFVDLEKLSGKQEFKVFSEPFIDEEDSIEQLIDFEAEHGSVVLMEVNTGSIKAIANLGRTSEGLYYEKLNYAVGESHEPGSTFKTMAMIAALEDKKIDINTPIETGMGKIQFFGKYEVRDSKRGGFGTISAGSAAGMPSRRALWRVGSAAELSAPDGAGKSPRLTFLVTPKPTKSSSQS